VRLSQCMQGTESSGFLIGPMHWLHNDWSLVFFRVFLGLLLLSLPLLFLSLCPISKSDSVGSRNRLGPDGR
jgi:hypothetical protein